MDGNTLVLKGILQIAEGVQPFLLCRCDVGLGKAVFAVLELTIELQQLSAASELLKVTDADQNLDNLRVERGIHLHFVQEVNEPWKEVLPPAVQRIGNALADVLD